MCGSTHTDEDKSRKLKNEYGLRDEGTNFKCLSAMWLRPNN